MYQYNFPEPHTPPLLDILRSRCSNSAVFNSAARFDSPRCAKSTRLGIIQIIEEWMNGDGDGAVPSSIFWLLGGAGVGKSALAQSLSERFERMEQLAASFFFFRADTSRNNGVHLIPTLVSQLVNTFKGIVPFVEDKIRNDPDLFYKRHQIQIQKLLIEPLFALKLQGVLVTHPRLIVIDGLDECQGQDIQCELLRVIARAIPQIPYPLRFLITSRPEGHIMHSFNHDRDLQAISVHRYNLSDDPDADTDIRKFLEEEFEEIHRTHILRQHLPDALTWPGREAIATLVERSSGHFVYASTVMRYIRSPDNRPDDRLQVILHRGSHQDRPYHQLDAMYRLIFQEVSSAAQLEKIHSVLGIVYFHSKQAGFFSRLVPDCATIEGLLELKAGDLALLLGPILSLIAIDGKNQVHMFHKSLIDYLLDATRSEVVFDLAQVHGIAANYILKQKIVQVVCDWSYFPLFAYHCQYAYLNDTLKDYLHALRVPSPKSGTTQLKSILGGNLDSFLRLILWLLLRTLSRQDFDPTGLVYKQFAASWIHSIFPGRTPLLQKVDNLKCWLKPKLDIMKSKPSNFVASEVGELKRELDTLLMKWKPSNIKSMNVGTDPDRRVAFIKQEHSVFSAYAKASISGNTNTIVSSLVFCDDFIHSYDVGNRDKESFLALRTYSRHGDACYQYTFVGCLDIVGKTLEYLKVVETYLFSDLYQGYGLEPDEDRSADSDTEVKFLPVNYYIPAVSKCELLEDGTRK